MNIKDISMVGKYPKVTGWWVYGHITPDGKIYIGYSNERLCCLRWRPKKYLRGSLQPYIEKYGWDNIKHIVFKDSLTQKQAEQLENLLIRQAKIDGWCINKHNSGGDWRDNPVEYRQQYVKDNYERIHNYQSEYNKKRLSTVEGKIYQRVSNYNRNHTPIETPLEAKNKYLEYGYIPSYIKNNDLV